METLERYRQESRSSLASSKLETRVGCMDPVQGVGKSRVAQVLKAQPEFSPRTSVMENRASSHKFSSDLHSHTMIRERTHMSK